MSFGRDYASAVMAWLCSGARKTLGIPLQLRRTGSSADRRMAAIAERTARGCHHLMLLDTAQMRLHTTSQEGTATKAYPNRLLCSTSSPVNSTTGDDEITCLSVHCVLAARAHGAAAKLTRTARLRLFLVCRHTRGRLEVNPFWRSVKYCSVSG